MKTTIAILCLIIGMNYSANAQNLQWAHIMGGDKKPVTALDVTTDAVGDVYTVGYFYDTLDIDPGANSINVASTGYGNAYLLKTDAAGNYINHWVFGITSGGNRSVASNLKFDSYGNMLVAGYFTGSNVDFDPDTSKYNLSAVGNGNNAFLMKSDASGKLLWAKNWNYNREADTYTERGPEMTLDASGNILMTGRFFGTVDFDPGANTKNLIAITENGYISKLDTGGNLLWVKQLITDTPSNRYIFPKSISTDAAGNSYIAGIFKGTVDFNPDSNANFILTAIEQYGFVMKLDANGNFQWAKKIGNDATPLLNYHSTNAVVSDALGNVYITGSFMDVVDFGTTQLTSEGLSDIYIAKLDASGNYQWAISSGTFYDEEEGSRIILDAAGSLYITGVFRGTIDFDPGVGVANCTTNGAADVFILKLTTSGNYVWAKGFGGVGGFERINAIAVNGAAVYTVGRVIGTINFDPNGSYYLTASPTHANIFLHKMQQFPTSINEVSHLINTTIFPNPASKEVTIDISTSGLKAAQVMLYNLQGKKLQETSFVGLVGKMNIENFPKGVYLIRIQGADTYAVKKLIIE